MPSIRPPSPIPRTTAAAMNGCEVGGEVVGSVCWNGGRLTRPPSRAGGLPTSRSGPADLQTASQMHERPRVAPALPPVHEAPHGIRDTCAINDRLLTSAGHSQK